MIVRTEDYGSSLAGKVIRVGTTGAPFIIILNSKHSEAQKLGTLSHELAHIFCGYLGQTNEGFWADRRGAPPDAAELEAEAVAYLITDRMNLDIGSVR